MSDVGCWMSDVGCCEIIFDSKAYSEDKNYLEKELSDIINGDANFVGIEEAEKRLDFILKQHEDQI